MLQNKYFHIDKDVEWTFERIVFGQNISRFYYDGDIFTIINIAHGPKLVFFKR